MNLDLPIENYSIGSQDIKYNLIFVLGTSRSGKSLLCRLLNSTGNYEWIHEPYALQMNIIAYDLCAGPEKKIYKNLAITSLKETINDRILLRNANFRPGEVTSIYNHLDSNDVFFRLNNIRSRDEVDTYIKDKKITFLVDLPDLLWHIPTIRSFFPNASVVNVVRNGNCVAYDVAQKGWYSPERMKKRVDNCIWYYSYGDTYLPWWLPKQYREIFLSGNNELRSYMYWISSLSGGGERDVDEVINYEHFTEEGFDCFSQESMFANLTPTSKSYEVLGDIRLYCLRHKRKHYIDKNKFPKEIITTFNSIMRRYGYE